MSDGTTQGPQPSPPPVPPAIPEGKKLNVTQVLLIVMASITGLYLTEIQKSIPASASVIKAIQAEQTAMQDQIKRDQNALTKAKALPDSDKNRDAAINAADAKVKEDTTQLGIIQNELSQGTRNMQTLLQASTTLSTLLNSIVKLFGDMGTAVTQQG